MKLSEWEVNSKWHVADTSDLAHNSSVWWKVPRAIGMDLTDYVNCIVKNYHATIEQFVDYGGSRIDGIDSLLTFHFDKYNDAHKYLLDFNRRLRAKK